MRYYTGPLGLVGLLWLEEPEYSREAHVYRIIQPFSQKSHTPTVPKEFQIGVHDPAEADLEHFWNCCSVGFLGERLYSIQIFIEPAYIISEMKNSTGDAQVRDVQLVHENEAFM